jgi:hypothetical protein
MIIMMFFGRSMTEQERDSCGCAYDPLEALRNAKKGIDAKQDLPTYSAKTTIHFS